MIRRNNQRTKSKNENVYKIVAEPFLFVVILCFYFGGSGVGFISLIVCVPVLAFIWLWLREDDKKYKNRRESRQVSEAINESNTEDDTTPANNVIWGAGVAPVQYDKDDTYDNFYSQREEEYRQEYGEDYEDAIDNAWEEHQRNKRR